MNDTLEWIKNHIKIRINKIKPIIEISDWKNNFIIKIGYYTSFKNKENNFNEKEELKEELITAKIVGSIFLAIFLLFVISCL